MSVGLRNRRFAIYTLTEATVDGVIGKTYTLAATWWGRLVPPSAREMTLALGADHQVDGTIAFSDEVVVTEDDVILDDDDAIYEVRAIMPRQMLRETHVMVERSRDAQSTYALAAS